MRLNQTQFREIMEFAQAISEIGALPCGCTPCRGTCYNADDLREAIYVMRVAAEGILDFMPLGEDAVG